MNIQIKNCINHWGLTFLVLCTAFFWAVGCVTRPHPDPLAGWKPDLTPRPSDQFIEKDYQDYIQKLSPKEKKYLGPVFYFENEAGQRAVRIETDINGTDCWYHILFYDKDNKRVKVVKYFYGKYRS
jgi:hypothetical protein